MRNFFFTLITLTFYLLPMSSCNRAAQDATPVEITRLEKAIRLYPAGSDAQTTRGFSLLSRILGTEMTEDNIDSLRQTEAFRFFAPDVEQRYASTDTLATSLGNLRSRWDLSSFPSEIYTIVSPYRQSIITIDTTAIFIALNHYMGADYAPYESFPEFERRCKIPERIPYDVARALFAAVFPYKTEKSTLLERICYEGAALYAEMKYVNNADLSTALGWTPEQLEWTGRNERQAWHNMIERDLIYSESPSVAARLLRPAPATTELHSEAPGAFGRYLGYRIVEAYLTGNPDVTLRDFMQRRLYASPTLLRDAHYQP